CDSLLSVARWIVWLTSNMDCVSVVSIKWCYSFFLIIDPATTEIYTLSLHDALPIFGRQRPLQALRGRGQAQGPALPHRLRERRRSEEHTSELQSRENLVCRLLLEKKKDSRKHDKDPPN